MLKSKAPDATWRRTLAKAWERQLSGDSAEAEDLYRQVLNSQPENFDAMHMLGVLALQSGRYERAGRLLGKAVAQRADSAAAQSNLATLRMLTGEFERAVTAYERVVALRPEAIEPCIHLADALGRSWRFEEALAVCERLIDRWPDAAAAHLAHTVALKNLQQPESALRACERSLALDPLSAIAWDKHGAALRDLGRLGDALASHEHALTLDPRYSQAREHAGMVRLLRGDLEQGWQLYESRAENSDVIAARYRKRPRWDGKNGKPGDTVLLYAEQGLGDTLQFCRYAPLVAANGFKVILCVQPGLRQLLSTLNAPMTIIGDNDPLPRHDWQCPLMSLPHVFGTRLTNIPSTVPYLRAEPERVTRWRALLGADGFKVGICWQGRRGSIDIGRSFPLTLLEPVARLEDVRLISLQKGVGLEQLQALPKGMTVEEPPDGWDEDMTFLDSAAILQTVDLLITSDTSIAHLAGALGRPAWVLLRDPPDWRWLLGRSDTPWYPTLRLFRQETPGDFAGVVRRVAVELAVLIAGDGSSARGNTVSGRPTPHAHPTSKNS